MKKVIPVDAALIPENAERVFEGQIFDVYQWPQEMFDGSEHSFEALKRPDTVLVASVVDDKVIVIEDTQPHTGTNTTFPGGRIDDTDGSTLEAAQRELHEETGYSFNNWKLIQVVQPHKKIEWFIYFYVAWDLAGQDEPHVDPGEKIEVKQLGLEELKTHIFNKGSYLKEASDIFSNIQNLDELKKLPEFNGQEVDR